MKSIVIAFLIWSGTSVLYSRIYRKKLRLRGTAIDDGVASKDIAQPTITIATSG